MNSIMAIAALLQWGVIETDQKLNLEQNLLLEEKGTAGFVVPAGSTAFVKDQFPLDALRVQYFKVEISPCPASIKDKTSEMTIINEIYGAQLSPNCQLGLYVEFNDFHTPSPFSERVKR